MKKSIIVFAIASMALSTGAHAHDWFTGTTDPTGLGGCCTGPNDPNPDCKPVPADMVGVITEVSEGYRVVLTIEQARFFNKATTAAIDEVVPWKRVQPGMSRGFAICLWQNKVRCFFAPSNT